MTSKVRMASLRSTAVRHSLRPVRTAVQAVEEMGFVQYDPISHPVRAQDLILAQRVPGYRAGDLDRRYERSSLDEDELHVYGVMAQRVRSLLHPRCDTEGQTLRFRSSDLETEVLAAVEERGRIHPKEARAILGETRTRNAWGGMSSATTKALESLHRRGVLRVARRDKGTKVYELERARRPELAPQERLRGLTILLANLLAPVPQGTLKQVLLQVHRRCSGAPVRPGIVAELESSGDLAAETVEGVRYLWPVSVRTLVNDGAERRVRFLAPFDPVVWDRTRFAHLWGWSYRLEAYTPPELRRFGYYALPVLWGDDAIGWANCRLSARGALLVRLGFAGLRPRSKGFAAELDREVQHLAEVVGAESVARVALSS